ncbi:site-specific integrase [Burkholderia vietnamiensis]|uniref:site-specific integrase n=1 Tax=Burkholderia vietnamiensis TaxID=60552 RepID=UPI001CF3126B|nr:site-specific integrase [Burkholderia vietnamiensis]MCA8285393.1 site-specific integrase [Burkholderia vietnamiensis]
MASISIKTSSTNKKYILVQIRKAGYPPFSKSFDIKDSELEKDKLYFYTRKDIKEYINSIEISLNKGEIPKNKNIQSTMIVDVFDEYLNSLSEEEKTTYIVSNINVLKKVNEFGSFNIGAINSDLLRKWYEKKKELDYANSTLHNNFMVLKKVMLWHSEKYKYTQNIFDKSYFDGSSNESERRLIDGEYELIIETIKMTFSKRNKLEFIYAIDVLIDTCMRAGELLKFKYKDVDFDIGTIFLSKEITKAKKSRTIPLTQKAWDILKAMFEADKDKENILEIRPFGKIWNATSSISDKFHLAVEEAKIEGLTLHNLRHEGISRLFEKTNLGDIEIASITGHTNLQNLKRYTHLRTKHMINEIRK